MKLFVKLMDLFGYGKRYESKRNQHLSQFKKSWKERTTFENILCECLYKVEFHKSQDRRYLGAAETVLITEGVLKGGGEAFPYEKFEQRIVGIKVQSNETYPELIVRLSKQYLKEREVL
jgi:hypothetical protein